MGEADGVCLGSVAYMEVVVAMTRDAARRVAVALANGSGDEYRARRQPRQRASCWREIAARIIIARRQNRARGCAQIGRPWATQAKRRARARPNNRDLRASAGAALVRIAVP